MSTEPEQAPQGDAEAPDDASMADAADALKDLLKTMSSLPSFTAAPPINRAMRRAMKHAKRKKGK